MSDQINPNPKFVLLIGFIAVAFMTFSAINYKFRPSAKPMPKAQEFQLIESVGEESRPQGSQTNASTENQNSASMPNIGDNPQLPKDIPSAMLEAMKERGMSIEDLQNENASTEQQFPEEMLKAMQAQNQNSGLTPPETTIYPPELIKAIEHINSHQELSNKEEIQSKLEAINKDNTDIDNRLDLAELFIQHNEYAAALYLLQEALIAEPSNAKIAYLMGVSLNKSGNLEAAAAEWERSISLEDNPGKRLELARLYLYLLHKPDLAKSQLDEALNSPNLTNDLKFEIEKELKQLQ